MKKGSVNEAILHPSVLESAFKLQPLVREWNVDVAVGPQQDFRDRRRVAACAHRPGRQGVGNRPNGFRLAPDAAPQDAIPRLRVERRQEKGFARRHSADDFCPVPERPRLFRSPPQGPCHTSPKHASRRGRIHDPVGICVQPEGHRRSARGRRPHLNLDPIGHLRTDGADPQDASEAREHNVANPHSSRAGSIEYDRAHGPIFFLHQGKNRDVHSLLV